MASKLEMVVRRGIVVAAALLAVGLALLVRNNLLASTEARHASFFENALAIKGAFRKALGPHPPVVRLVIEPEEVTAKVVVGNEATQFFVFSQASGFVSSGAADAFPERDDIAFSMSTVPFAEIPQLVVDGERALGVMPARLVVDRVPGSKQLRYRVFTHEGRALVVSRTPPPP